MKTSFYFVLWILIYPILGLFHNEMIYQHSFLVALIGVYGISWLLNRSMPDTLLYEEVSATAPILEDVYTGNVRSFSRRLYREALVETVTAIYFCITTVVLIIIALQTRVNDWIALLIFGFFMVGAMMRSVKLVKAHFLLKGNPTPEQCMEIAEDTYKLDYASYYETHLNSTYEGLYPPRPKHYKGFQIVSLIIAIVAALLGLIYVISGIILLMTGLTFETSAVAVMYFLYGSLAAYFGVKDIISIVISLKKQSTDTKDPAFPES